MDRIDQDKVDNYLAVIAGFYQEVAREVSSARDRAQEFYLASKQLKKGDVAPAIDVLRRELESFELIVEKDCSGETDNDYAKSQVKEIKDLLDILGMKEGEGEPCQKS